MVVAIGLEQGSGLIDSRNISVVQLVTDTPLVKTLDFGNSTHIDHGGSQTGRSLRHHTSLVVGEKACLARDNGPRPARFFFSAEERGADKAISS